MSDSSGSTLRNETGEGTRPLTNSDRAVDAHDGEDYDSMPDLGQPEDLDDGGADYASLVDHGGGDELPGAGTASKNVEPTDHRNRQADYAHERFFVSGKC